MDFTGLFPPLKGKSYFDAAASSLTALPVLEKMREFYSGYRANVHRGTHSFSRKASEEYETVYSKLAKFFNAGEQEFASVRNATEALNGVALGLDWNAGDEVIVTDVEHHSNFLPWLRLREKGVKVRVLEAGPEGSLSQDSLAALLSNKTRLVTFTACSNVLGARVPVKDIAKTAKDGGALVLVDAAQYVGHHEVDLRDWPIDYLAFSGHKCLGPTGVGVLFHREGAPLKPWFVGGGTISDVSLDSFELINNRERFEAGTPAIAEWIGLGAVIDLLSRTGFSAIEAHERVLAEGMLDVFSDIPDAVVYGPRNPERKACALFSFNMKNLSHNEVAVMLDEMGFAVRSGHHCAMPLTKKLGVSGSVRASLHVYNTLEEVNGFGEALEKISLLG